jgi:hypothetical protein
MMKIKFLRVLLLLTFLLGMNFGSGTAQTYSFQLSRSVVNVFINKDGSATVEYQLTFINDASASALDFVDIGTPNSDVNLSNISADVSGTALTDIASSPYVTPGVAVGLGASAIQPGQSGTVHVVIANIPGFLFPGTEKEVEDYASLQFSPTWFGSEYCHSSTEMTVTLFLPDGMKENEPRYYPPKNWPGPTEPESGFDDQGRVYYRWSSKDANGYTQYSFGSSFPARLVPKESIVRPDPFAGVGAVISWLISNICWVGFCGLFVGPWIFGIYQGTVGANKRKLQYMPPKIAIEGHGIKRGLTSIEAAILMEEPLDKILTMVLFAVVKKNAARVTSKEPLKIEVLQPSPPDLQGYETDFLQAFSAPNLAAQRAGLQELMIKLVKSVTEKMKGFSRKETLDYYKNIMEKAWQYVQAADTPEVKTAKYDEVMDWTMLDRKYGERTQDVFRTGPVFVPSWWGNYDPSFHPTGFGGGHTAASLGSAPLSGPSLSSMPSLPGSDFAASMVNSVQHFSSGVIGDLNAFTGGITNKTNPVPVSTGSSGGSRSGGGHSCACACAGCACACAGGGR